MPISIGFIIYILVMVVSALVRRSVTQQAQKENAQRPQDFERPKVDKPESFSRIFEEEPEKEVSDSFIDPGTPGSLSAEMEAEEQWEWEQIEKPAAPKSRRRKLDGVHLSQAIVMSEIIRKPRAKRPWPSR